MRSKMMLPAFLLAAATVLNPQGAGWQKDFQVDKKTLGLKGSNPYFNLTPAYRLTYRHGDEDDVLTVLNES